MPSTLKIFMPESVYLTRRAKFSAAHYFWLEDCTPDENFARFGPSSNRNGHGHNYEVLVSIKGPCDAETGMVINLKDIKQILDDVVVTPLNFKSLNKDIPHFKTHFPTLENLATYLWPQLADAITRQGCELDSLKISEDEDLYVEYFGGKLPA